MRKLLGITFGLLIASTSYADVIAVTAFSADSGVDHLNTFRTVVVNVINGQIEGSGTNGSTKNILADSLGEADFADAINPRVRDAEILGIGVDTVSGGTLTQNAFVESGCVPATDSDLTSDISACVAYVNGYRVSKSATSTTYDASMDSYVDLSQSGTYTVTAVANGAAQPTVASNSVRLAKVVTSATEITTVTVLYTTRLPGLVIPSQYREGLYVSRDSSTTITVLPGSCEINNAMLTKTSTTTLTISTAGDYAGGTSLRAASTYGFVGIDTSGNIKLHTTAPTHTNFAVSQTVGKKRYATWSSTVYRILGWFYMDGAQLVENASNIKEGDVSNTIQSNDATSVALAATTPTMVARANFYSSGGNILLMGLVSGDAGAATDELGFEFGRSSTAIVGSGGGSHNNAVGQVTTANSHYLDSNRPQGTTAYTMLARTNTGSQNMRRRAMIIQEQ